MRIMLFGTFDDLHPGHRYVLDEAMKKSEEMQSARDKRQETRDKSQTPKKEETGNKNWNEVIVVIARDENVLRFKGRSPVQTQEERMAAIKKAYPQAEVMLGHASDFLASIRSVKPDLILLGYDQRLPPGVSLEDLGVPTERIDAFRPEEFKSSLRRRNSKLKIQN